MRAGAALPPGIYHRLSRQLMLEACKWDPQVGDVSTISPFPLLISRATWQHLSQLASSMTSELLSAEQELLMRPALHRTLALPWSLRRSLRQANELDVTPAAGRVFRFDFHWTFDGWRISEVNSDVPGGFAEASELPALMAPYYPHTALAGHPEEAWTRAIARAVAPGQSIGLLAAAGFMEDQQIIAYLARLLEARGIASRWIAPRNLYWHDGMACVAGSADDQPLGAILRFFQSEWLCASRYRSLFVGGKTPVANPGIAVLTESKRLPLLWDQLSTAMPTFRKLLPCTADPRDVDWRGDDAWLVKSAFCNTGDTVSIRPLLTDRQWRNITRAVRFHPGNWIAQRRFVTRPIDSPVGAIYPCLGIYTVNGMAAGIYGRFSQGALINYAAVDVAVLIDDHTEATA